MTDTAVQGHLDLGLRFAGPGGGNNPMFGGAGGIGRLYSQSMGTEISWLLPASRWALLIGSIVVSAVIA